MDDAIEKPFKFLLMMICGIHRILFCKCIDKTFEGERISMRADKGF